MSKTKINGNFGVAPNELLNDSSISLKAKGLYVYMQSKPDDWVFSLDRICSQNKDGKASVRNSINELCEAGFLSKERLNKEEGGTIYLYKLTDPSFENRTFENATMGKSNVRKSDDLVIKNNSKKEIIETKIVDDRFEKFWNLYGKDIQKEKCYSEWKFINTIDKDKILNTLPNYIASTPEVQFRRHPITYLRNKGWLDEVIIPKSQNPFSEAKDSPRPPTAIITVPDNY
jgi:hypothetical protein